MAAIDTLVVRILSTGSAGVQRQLLGIAGAAVEMEVALARSQARVGALAAVSAAGFAAISGLIIQSVKHAGEQEKALAGFETTLKSRVAALEMLSKVRQFDLETPFNYQESLRSARALQAAGYSAQQIIPTMKILGDTVAAVGGNTETFERIMHAWTMLHSRRVLNYEVIRSFVHAGIPIAKIIQDELKLTDQQMKTLGRQNISAEIAAPAILKGFEKLYGGGMDRMMKTLPGAVENLESQFSKLAATIGVMLTPELTRMTQSLAETVGNITKLIETHPELAKWSIVLGGATATAMTFAGVWQLIAASSGAIKGLGALGAAGAAGAAAGGVGRTGGALGGALTAATLGQWLASSTGIRNILADTKSLPEVQEAAKAARTYAKAATAATRAKTTLDIAAVAEAAALAANAAPSAGAAERQAVKSAMRAHAKAQAAEQVARMTANHLHSVAVRTATTAEAALAAAGVAGAAGGVAGTSLVTRAGHAYGGFRKFLSKELFVIGGLNATEAVAESNRYAQLYRAGRIGTQGGMQAARAAADLAVASMFTGTKDWSMYLLRYRKDPLSYQLGQGFTTKPGFGVAGGSALLGGLAGLDTYGLMRESGKSPLYSAVTGLTAAILTSVAPLAGILIGATNIMSHAILWSVNRDQRKQDEQQEAIQMKVSNSNLSESQIVGNDAIQRGRDMLAQADAIQTRAAKTKDPGNRHYLSMLALTQRRAGLRLMREGRAEQAQTDAITARDAAAQSAAEADWRAHILDRRYTGGAATVGRDYGRYDVALKQSQNNRGGGVTHHFGVSVVVPPSEAYTYRRNRSFAPAR